MRFIDLFNSNTPNIDYEQGKQWAKTKLNEKSGISSISRIFDHFYPLATEEDENGLNPRNEIPDEGYVKLAQQFRHYAYLNRIEDWEILSLQTAYGAMYDANGTFKPEFAQFLNEIGFEEYREHLIQEKQTQYPDKTKDEIEKIIDNEIKATLIQAYLAVNQQPKFFGLAGDPFKESDPENPHYLSAAYFKLVELGNFLVRNPQDINQHLQRPVSTTEDISQNTKVGLFSNADQPINQLTDNAIQAIEFHGNIAHIQQHYDWFCHCAEHAAEKPETFLQSLELLTIAVDQILPDVTASPQEYRDIFSTLANNPAKPAEENQTVIRGLVASLTPQENQSLGYNRSEEVIAREKRLELLGQTIQHMETVGVLAPCKNIPVDTNIQKKCDAVVDKYLSKTNTTSPFILNWKQDSKRRFIPRSKLTKTIDQAINHYQALENNPQSTPTDKIDALLNVQTAAAAYLQKKNEQEKISSNSRYTQVDRLFNAIKTKLTSLFLEVEIEKNSQNKNEASVEQLNKNASPSNEEVNPQQNEDEEGEEGEEGAMKP